MVFVVSSFALVHSLYQHTWLAKWQSQPCVLIKGMNMLKGWFRFIRSAILKQFWRGAGYRFCGPDTQHKHLLSSPGREISKRVDARKKGSENVPKSDCNRPDDPEPRRLHHRGAERYKYYTVKMLINLISIAQGGFLFICFGDCEPWQYVLMALSIILTISCCCCYACVKAKWEVGSRIYLQKTTPRMRDSCCI